MANYKNKEYDEKKQIDDYSTEYLLKGKRVYWERNYSQEKEDKKQAEINEIDGLLLTSDVKNYLKKIRGLA